MKFVRGFGLFWWDFIVGDSIILAIGVVAVVATGFALASLRGTGLVEIIVPAGVVLTLALSLPRKR